MIIGHQPLIRDLKALADERKLSHGYIFFGSRRIGKKCVALGLANYLETGEFSPNLKNQPLSDALVIGPDEQKSIGIDKIRDIKNFLWQMPNRSAYRTVIVDDCIHLTDEAQNALLKITEEPPASGLVILVVEDPESLRPTLQSRLEKIYFAPVAAKEIEKWLVTAGRTSPDQAREISQSALGAPGLAWAFIYDERFGEMQKLAKKFLATPVTGRRLFLKDLVADEHFNL
ncbi:MAG: hypothetical protein AAB686_03345, partial [Patescibacteria group bacterium]